MSAKNDNKGASFQKVLKLHAGDKRREKEREERKRQRLHDLMVERIEKLADLANDSIAAAACGDTKTAAKLREDVCRGVFHECNANICSSCPIRNELFEDWPGKARMECDAGSLCAFAREVTEPRMAVRGCHDAMRLFESDLAKAKYAEGLKRIELADLEALRKTMETAVEEGRRDLAKAKAEWASVFEKYSK